MKKYKWMFIRLEDMVLLNYKISKEGLIKLNYDFGKISFVGKIMSPQINKGYLLIQLTIDGKRKAYRVHRLVWQTFVGDIPESYHIHHKDENKTNNNLDNLECLSASVHIHNTNSGENHPFFGKKLSLIHRKNIGKARITKGIARGEKNGNSKLNWDIVREIRRLYANLDLSQRDLADKFNVTRCCIRDIVKNVRWKEL